jgi:hypothetical protein
MSTLAQVLVGSHGLTEGRRRVFWGERACVLARLHAFILEYFKYF